MTGFQSKWTSWNKNTNDIRTDKTDKSPSVGSVSSISVGISNPAVEKRELIWDEYTAAVQQAHGIRPQVPVLPNLKAKLESALNRLSLPIMTLSDAEFINALDEWKSIWMASIAAANRRRDANVR